MKKIFLTILIGFIFINSSALTYGGCDYSTVTKMKSIIKNINISYDYKIINNEAYFDVTINNLTDDIYFYDTSTNKNYYYSNTNEGEITIYNYNNDSGSYKFYSNVNDCYGISLGSKYYKFPNYNKYYNHSLCADIPNYSLCQKWINVNYSEEEFEAKVLEYKKIEDTTTEEETKVEYNKTVTDRAIELYISYYPYFLGTIIFVCCTIIFIHNKKNSFKL